MSTELRFATKIRLRTMSDANKCVKFKSVKVPESMIALKICHGFLQSCYKALLMNVYVFKCRQLKQTKSWKYWRNIFAQSIKTRGACIFQKTFQSHWNRRFPWAAWTNNFIFWKDIPLNCSNSVEHLKLKDYTFFACM